MQFNKQDIVLIDTDSRSNQLATPVANAARVDNYCKNNNLTTIEGRHGMMIKG